MAQSVISSSQVHKLIGIPYLNSLRVEIYYLGNFLALAFQGWLGGFELFLDMHVVCDFDGHLDVYLAGLGKWDVRYWVRHLVE